MLFIGREAQRKRVHLVEVGQSVALWPIAQVLRGLKASPEAMPRPLCLAAQREVVVALAVPEGNSRARPVVMAVPVSPMPSPAQPKLMQVEAEVAAFQVALHPVAQVQAVVLWRVACQLLVLQRLQTRAVVAAVASAMTVGPTNLAGQAALVWWWCAIWAAALERVA